MGWGGGGGGGMVDPQEVVHYECVFPSKKAPKYVNQSKKHFAWPVNVHCKDKFIECSIINSALSLLMKHLVIGQHQKAPNFSAFH